MSVGANIFGSIVMINRNELETIYKVILTAAQRKDLVRYSELIALHNWPQDFAARTLGNRLNELLKVCRRRRWPAMAVIVVRKYDDRLTGSNLAAFVRGARDAGYIVRNPEDFEAEQRKFLYDWAPTAPDTLDLSDPGIQDILKSTRHRHADDDSLIDDIDQEEDSGKANTRPYNNRPRTSGHGTKDPTTHQSKDTPSERDDEEAIAGGNQSTGYQVLQSSKNEFRLLSQSMSRQRLEEYLRHVDGCENRALDLYHWNLEISAGMIIPLGVTEVVIRNAIVEAIENQYNKEWFNSKGIIRSLGLQYPKKQKTKFKNSGQLITKQTFSIWNNFLISRSHKKLWDSHFHNSFPNAPTNQPNEVLRKLLFKALDELRYVRNRVAHHEPIYKRKLEEDIKRIDWIIRWRCNVTADWLSSVNPVPSLMSRRPGKPRS